MNRKNRRMTARERREQVRRSSFIVRLVIMVVALIECILLLTFSTYSWIESSSSLIISTGKDGNGKLITSDKYISLSVANNMNYQVLVANDSAGNATLTDNKYNVEEGDGGFYRSVRYFNYARTSSADGKTFYFPKRNTTHDATTGYDIYNGTVTGYRAGDTADYNTTYTYVDFKLKNTTRANKSFYFDSRNPIFTFTGTDATLSGNKKASDVIKNAMRLSVQKNNDTPDIYSLNGKSANAINSTSGDWASTPSRNITDGYTDGSGKHSYKYTGDAEKDIPVFTSEYDNSGEDPEDSISVRIWFEMHDADYAGLSTTDKTTVDNILASPDSLQIDIAFINDNVDYGQLYFDDFAFSDLANKLGKFVTDENSSYEMYFRAYNAKLNKVVSYPMSVSVNEDNDAKRWMCSVPIPYVVQGLNQDGTRDNSKNYLTGNTPLKLSDAYFYYGTENSEVYKWNLPGSLDVEKVNDRWRITNATAYMRNLGVVRSSADQPAPIPGFIQFSNDASGKMQLFYLKDHTTALTSLAYNTADASNWNKEFLKLKADTTINTGIEVTQKFDHTAIEGYENYYYADIPSGCYVMFATGTTSNIDYEQQTKSNGGTTGAGILPNDGDIFRITGRENPSSAKTYLVQIVQDASLPKLNTPGYVRVYFDITDDYAESWPLGDGRALYVHYWGNASGTAKIGSISEITTSTVVSDDARKPSNVYLNRKTAGNHETAATKTVSMYCYDNANGMFKAYIPIKWITDTGFDIHHNQQNGFYNLSDDKVRWTTGSTSASDTYTYTALGYTDATNLTNLSAGTGVGTWSDTREISFSTELLNKSISSPNRYKVGFGSGSYAMIPSDDLHLKFSAWVPVDGLSSQSSNHKIAFTRYASYTAAADAANGTWIPHENITDDEETYYPVVLNGGSSGDTVGWFHVAVLSDATYKNLIYQTLSQVTGSSLAYSYDGEDSHYTTIASNSGGTLSEQTPYCLDNHHWVVPMKIGDTLYDHIYFKWIPYPATADTAATQFIYDQDISDDVKYITVTE